MAKRAVIDGAAAPLRFEIYEVPSPKPDSVRVKIAYSGVCHSDLHIREDSGAYGLKLRDALGEDNFKRIVLGHEICGHIEKAGPGVDLSKYGLNIGDQVIVYPWLGCQKCPQCISEQTNLCKNKAMVAMCIGTGPYRPGGYATHIVVEPRFLVKPPSDVPLDVACLLACSGGTAFSALQKLSASVQFGSAYSSTKKARIMIIGVGGLGLWAVKLGRAMYGNSVHIIAVDIDQSKLDIATARGADETVLWSRSASEKENAAAAMKNGEIHGAIDFIGSTVSVATGLRTLVRNGSLVIIGLAGGTFKSPIPDIVSMQKHIQGNNVMSIEQLRQLAKLVSEKKITYPDITHYKLDEVNTALEHLEKGQVSGRAVLKLPSAL